MSSSDLVRIRPLGTRRPASLKGQFESRGTRLLYLDDESYAADEAKPLPE